MVSGVIRERTSEAATAERSLGLRAFVLILAMAAVESEKIVYLRPLSCRVSKAHRARQIADCVGLCM